MEALVRVVDAAGFSAAARRWGRSKASVSKYVSDLEDYLGVPLLRRSTRSVGLTSAGRDYYRRCVELLGELDSLEASLREDQLSPRGNLRVTAPPGFAKRYLPLMTTELVARYPEITVDLDLTHRMVDLIEEGVDVALRITEPRDSSLVARRLAPAPLLAVAAPDYLKRRGRPRIPSQLRDHDCLVDTNHRDQQRWRFVHDGRTQTVSVTGPFRVNSPDAVCELALAGHGIALLPRFVAEDALAAKRLVQVLRGKVALAWSIYAVYPRRRYLPSRVRAFVRHMADALA